MIIVKLMGGLGNQMFQYAFGRAVSLDKGEKLVIDKSFYDIEHENTTSREYELYYFNIIAESSTKKYSGEYINQIRERVLRCLARHFNILLPNYILERTLSYDVSQFKDKKGNLYFDGYWQSEKYFSHHAEQIKNDFQIRMPQSEINQKWLEKISNTCSVCLHVRRGDYVSNPNAAKCHGVLNGDDGLKYYRTAISYIASKVQNPVFFLFSDDPEWVKDNLSVEYPVHYMDHNGPSEDYEDLRLMTQCKHFIIANSSFSWWGAWLSEYKDKIVVCPKQWFKDSKIETDIICDGWISL